MTTAPPSEQKSPFISRLTHALRALGMNDYALERQLAKVQGKEKINKGYLSRLIKEDRSPLVATAEALADALGVQRAWLLAGAGPMIAGEPTVCAEIPGWADAALEVARAGRVPAFALSAVSRRPALVVPKRATADLVRELTLVWWSWARSEDVEAAAAAEAEGIADVEDDPPSV